MAGLARDAKGNKFSHQWRIRNNVLKKFANLLEENRAKIKASETFEYLYDVIYKAKSGLKGIGKLTIYDTALRIGANLGLRPSSIYLHAGTIDGAKAMGLYNGEQRLDPSKTREEFSCLEPYEIEDLLCIYKDDLKQLVRSKVARKS